MLKCLGSWKCFLSHQSCPDPVTFTPDPVSLYWANNQTSWSHAEMLRHRQSDGKFLSTPKRFVSRPKPDNTTVLLAHRCLFNPVVSSYKTFLNTAAHTHSHANTFSHFYWSFCWAVPVTHWILCVFHSSLYSVFGIAAVIAQLISSYTSLW